MMMNFRLAKKSDLKTVMTWIPDAESCLTWAGPRVRFPLALEQLYSDLEIEKIRTYSLEDDEVLLALGQIRQFENNRGHLARIVVNPAVRGKGVGRTFCKELIDEARNLNCRTISLHVVKDNAVAIHLYETLGFSIPSKQPGNIREDIYYMQLTTR